jgi:hypothetical protein
MCELLAAWKVFGDRLRLPARQSLLVLAVVTAGCALGPSTKPQTSASCLPESVCAPDGESYLHGARTDAW